MNEMIEAHPHQPPRQEPAVLRGELAPGIDCYVLGPRPEDHRLSKRAFVAALTPGAKRSHSDRFIERIPASFLTEVGVDTPAPNLPIVEVTTDGHTAHTYSSTDFVKILTAYTKWLASGTMRKDQEHLGRNAANVLASFASAGIVVAIRHACGLADALPKPPPPPSLVPDMDKVFAIMMETSRQIRDVTGLITTSLETSMLAREEARSARAETKALEQRVESACSKLAELSAAHVFIANGISDRVWALELKSNKQPSAAAPVPAPERLPAPAPEPKRGDTEPPPASTSASEPPPPAPQQATVDQVRALLPDLSPTFSRSDLGRRLWPHQEWFSSWFLPAIVDLCAAGELREYEGRSRSGSPQTRYEVVGAVPARERLTAPAPAPEPKSTQDGRPTILPGTRIVFDDALERVRKICLTNVGAIVTLSKIEHAARSTRGNARAPHKFQPIVDTLVASGEIVCGEEFTDAAGNMRRRYVVMRVAG